MSYIVYFARTPVEVKENEEGEDQEEEEEEEIQNLQQVDPEWVMEHAKQGMDVKISVDAWVSPRIV